MAMAVLHEVKVVRREERKGAQGQPHQERDEKESVHDCSSGAMAAALRPGLGQRERLQQMVNKLTILDDGCEEPKAVSRVLVARDGHERAAQLTIIRELLGAVDEPEIELFVDVVPLPERQRRDVLEIVDQVAGMDAEEARQQRARLAGEVAALAALDLRQVRLADAGCELFADGLADLDLGHLAVEAAGVAFESAEPGKLFAECHNDLQYIADCYISQVRR